MSPQPLRRRDSPKVTVLELGCCLWSWGRCYLYLLEAWLLQGHFHGIGTWRVALEADPGPGRGGAGFAWMIFPRGTWTSDCHTGLASPGRSLGGDSQRPSHQIQNLVNRSPGRRQGLPASVCSWAPPSEMAQGPSVKASALSEALSPSSAPLWFGAQQCLQQSLLQPESKGKWDLLTQEQQPMVSLMGLAPSRAWMGVTEPV